jgi:signal transduction histidine kinase/CheY-like chemotaxis protein
MSSPAVSAPKLPPAGTAPFARPASGVSLRAMLGVFIVGVTILIGLRVWFGGLQADIRAQRANEQARQFVGEEVVVGIQELEKDLFQMATTPNLTAFRRSHHLIDESLTKLRHDLTVLEKGGTSRRLSQLNIDGQHDMKQEATYRPDAHATDFAMETIEIAPLLDQLASKTSQLELLLVRRWAAQEAENKVAFFSVVGEIDLFMKHLPPYFERLNENANRLFFDSTQRLTRLEADLQAQSRHLLWVEVSLFLLVVVLGSLAVWVFLLNIKRANRQLALALSATESARDAAEHASHAKSEFVSRMSHELRTPLNAILGFAELLEAEQLSASQQNYVGLINSSGKHLMDLINAVLDHAKIESGSLTLEHIAYDFADTIEYVNTIVAPRASDKGLSYVTSISPALPRRVMGDPTRLRQVLINLLINAIKFTENGSVEMRVAAEDGQLHFSVRDSGIGMDAEALDRLFKPFSQADDSVTRKFGGTGLGLVISRELIEAMGGTIQVESAPGAGTCFWFWLPFTEAPALAPAPDPTVAAVNRAPSANGVPVTPPGADADLPTLLGGKLLLVDDNVVNQKLASAMLTRLKLTFDVASNGQEAVDMSAAYTYSTVLMDMEMPVLDGVSATQAIRAREQANGTTRPLPIIAMTANALQEDRDRCMAAGMDGYIAKPVNLRALETELRRVGSLQLG